VPVILVSNHHEDAVLSRVGTDNVMAYLVKPVGEGQLKVTIHLAMMLFQQYLDLRRALEDRKAVERAKGVVVLRLGLGEEEAYRQLRKLASVQNRKLAEVARDVLKSEELFRALEACDAPPSPARAAPP
jgi:two-component system, response regulator PdtaR